MVVLESTVYPVTAQTWYPELERLGVKIGVDVEIAYCPERFNPGDPAHGVRQVARVIGCPNEDVGRGLVALYSRLTEEDVRYVGKLEVAEAAKVIENVQRDINIALVNELARIFPELDVDVEDVLLQQRQNGISTDTHQVWAWWTLYPRRSLLHDSARC